jgi:prophage tail gpP-like protein
VGQKQGQNAFSAIAVNVECPPQKDPEFPFYKPFIFKDEFGGDQPKQQARLALEKMRHDRFRLAYTVRGHSQGNKNWSINELCAVRDDDPYFELYGDYLIYGRTFEKKKDDKGTTTKLRLGLPGMIA